MSVFVAGRPGPGTFLHGGRGADGQVQTETRGLNLDSFQTDILYIEVQYVEKAEGLRWEGWRTPTAGVNNSALAAKFLNSHPAKHNCG